VPTYLAGQKLRASDLPGGFIRRSRRVSNSGVSTGVAIGVLRIDNIPIVSGRIYTLNVSPMYFVSTVVSDTIEVDLRTSTTGIASVGSPVYSALVDDVKTASSATVNRTKGMSIDYISATTGNLSLLLTVCRIGGTGSCQLGASANQPLDLWITDEGADPGDSGILL
jgi:hypothetical protein